MNKTQAPQRALTSRAIIAVVAALLGPSVPAAMAEETIEQEYVVSIERIWDRPLLIWPRCGSMRSKHRHPSEVQNSVGSRRSAHNIDAYHEQARGGAIVCSVRGDGHLSQCEWSP